MYTPKAFSVQDKELIYQVMDDYSFATVISRENISHLPVLRIPGSEPLKLYSHLSRHNPQCLDLQDSTSVRLVFHGPHCYITPTWYGQNDVPTWNYVSIHVEGTVRQIADPDELEKILKDTSAFYENKYGSNWKFQLPADLSPMEDVPQFILGFEITVTDIQAKFKLNQNRSLEDQRKVIAGLKTHRQDENSLAVARLMELNMKRQP